MLHLRRVRVRARGLLLILFAVSLVAYSCASDTPTPEERAQSLDRLLMCPVCPAETIDQSQADLAIQMRSLVREKLQSGESEEEILDFFVDRYGKSVLSQPPTSGFNLVVWVVPPIALVGGLALVWLAARQLGQRRQPNSQKEAPEGRPDLEQYLRQIDDEFLAFERARSGPERGGEPGLQGGEG
jgi:cytochrome c-type biogenesis protein CcmH